MWATRVKSGIFNLIITRNPHLGNFHKSTYFSMLHAYYPLPGDVGMWFGYIYIFKNQLSTTRYDMIFSTFLNPKLSLFVEFNKTLYNLLLSDAWKQNMKILSLHQLSIIIEQTKKWKYFMWYPTMILTNLYTSFYPKGG